MLGSKHGYRGDGSITAIASHGKLTMRKRTHVIRKLIAVAGFVGVDMQLILDQCIQQSTEVDSRLSSSQGSGMRNELITVN